MVGAGLSATIGVSATYLGVKERIARLELEKTKVENGYVLQQRDLNNNGAPEGFYEIDGMKFFLTIDGKNLEDALKE